MKLNLLNAKSFGVFIALFFNFQFSPGFIGIQSYAQECGIIYVIPAGASSGIAGTKATPANLTYGLSLVTASDTIVWLADGVYNISNTLQIPANTTIEGGFDPVTWVKTNANNSIIARDASNPDLANKALIALEGSSISNFRLQDLTIIVANAPINSGITVYGIHLISCSNYNITRCAVTAGNGGGAADGIMGADGLPGNPGGNGTGGDDDVWDQEGQGGIGGIGGGAGGGTGGSGGTLSNGCGCVGDNGNPGGIPSNCRAGGGGGGGASGGQATSSLLGDGLNGGSGGNGSWCPACGGANTGGGGPGIQSGGCNDGASCDFNLSGKDGSSGSSGAPGSPGAAGGTGSHAGGYWFPGAPGASGTDGCGGQGGHGGGGGAGEGGELFGCTPGAGDGGGGGGGGGEGGAGGTGGEGGGSSYAVYLFNNGASGVIQDCNLISGSSGLGGNGGLGGIGGTGGGAGQGYQFSNDDIGCGGHGGSGGNGVDGGKGGDGQPGENSSLYEHPGGTPAIVSGITAVPGNPPVISVLNIGCTNIEVIFNATTSNTWNFGAGATPATATGAGPISVTYSTLGRKTITFAGVTFTDYVHIFRSGVPSGNFISPNDTTISAGCPIDFSSTLSGVFYQWTFGGGASPDTLAGAGLQNVNNIFFNTVGTYNVILNLTPADSCCGKPLDTITVTVDTSSLTLNLTATDDSICEGDTIIFTAVPAVYVSYEFLINGVSVQNSASNVYTTDSLAPGDSVQVIAFAGGCFTNPIALLTPLVVPTPKATLTINDPDSTICQGDSITFTATPTFYTNYEFLVNTDTVQSSPSNIFSIDTLSDGDTITVIVPNILGCPGPTSNSILITVNPLPSVSLSSSDGDTICTGDSVSFIASPPGYSLYGFIINGSLVQGGPDSIYTTTTLVNGDSVTVGVVDINGCVSPISNAIVFTVNPIPAAPTALADTTYCAGNAVADLTATGVNIEWFSDPGLTTSIGSGSPFPVSPGTGATTYYVTQTVSGCQSLADSVVITVNPSPVIDSTSSTNPDTCGVDNGTITIYVVGGTPPLLYSIDGGATFTGSGNFIGLASGNYYVVVTDSNNCGVFGDTITMTAPGTPTPPLAGTDTTYCAGAPMIDLTATASSGGILTWYTDPGLTIIIDTGVTLTPDTTIGTTIYYVTETVGLCRSLSSSVTITINALPIVTLISSDDSICMGESVTFTADSAGCGNYDFYDGTTLVQSGPDSIFTTTNLDMANNVYVIVTCSGCSSSPSNAIVTTVDSFAFVNAGADTLVCEGSVAFTLSGFSPPGGLWSGAGITDSIGIFNSVLTGGDTVTLIYTFSNANCSVFKNKFIYVNVLPIADAGNDLSVCPEERISLNATGGIQYLWDTDPTLSDINIFNPVANPEFTTEYIVKVTDVNGCSNVDSVIVTLKDTCIENQLWLPNAFSPNDDEKNDIFYVRGVNIEKIKFVIYNRWGEIVFENNDFPVNDPDVGWDGKHNGKKQNVAVFVYYVEAEFINGEKGTLDGDVTLIR